MKLKHILLVVLKFLAVFPVFASSEIHVAEVYRDDHISISAGIVDLENRIIHIGDVLPMHVVVTYSDNIRLQEAGSEFFSGSWPESKGAYLLEYDFPAKIQGQSAGEVHATFRFQLMGCPDGTTSCKGVRNYKIPEFGLEYQIVDETGEELSIVVARFQPWPMTIAVTSSLPLGEDGELNRFSEYFPTGAFPQPVTGEAREQDSLVLIAGGLFLFLGGILMSPLSLFKRRTFEAKSKSRWEQVIDQLQAGEFKQDERILDALRRSMVWYCTDELGVDPFYWIKHEEEVSGQKQKGSGDYSELKDLFIKTLHNPPGQSRELLEEFQKIVKNR